MKDGEGGFVMIRGRGDTTSSPTRKLRGATVFVSSQLERDIATFARPRRGDNRRLPADTLARGPTSPMDRRRCCRSLHLWQSC